MSGLASRLGIVGYIVGAGLSADAHAADCTRRVADAELADEAAAVEQSFTAGDEQRFEDGYTRLARAVGCLGEVPAPATMARVRLVEGVRAFGQGDADRAAGAFLAARALAPEISVPVYPAEHEIWGVLRRWDPVRAERERLPAPRTGALYVDGYPTRERFVAAPALVQHVDGEVVTTWAVGPGEAPEYPVRHPVRTALLATSASFAVTGAGLLVASAGPRSDFRSGEVDSVSRLATLRSTTNTLSAAGLVGLALSAGAGAVAVVEWQR